MQAYKGRISIEDLVPISNFRAKDIRLPGYALLVDDAYQKGEKIEETGSRFGFYRVWGAQSLPGYLYYRFGGEESITALVDDILRVVPVKNAAMRTSNTDIPIINLGEQQADVPEVLEDNFGSNSNIENTFYYLEETHSGQALTLKKDLHILVIGGTVYEVERLLAHYPQSTITVINLGKDNLIDLQNHFKAMPDMKQKLHLFQGDARHLSGYHAPDGSEYFPEASFDLVTASGVDFSTFNISSRESRKILIDIATQEARVVARGGIIAHLYDWGNNVQYQAQAIANGILEVLDNPRMGLFFKVDKAQLSRNGGIDLTPANNVLQTQNAGEAIKFHLNSAQLAQLQNAPGFVPVIINIQPMTNLREFLGLDQPQANTQLASAT